MEVFWILWILFSICMGILASSRGRSGVGFGLLSLITSPIFTLIVILVIKDLKKDEALAEQRRRDHELQIESVRTIASTLASGRSVEVGQVAAPGVRSIADEIEKLDALRTRGLLTDAEFSAQKAELLKRVG